MRHVRPAGGRAAPRPRERIGVHDGNRNPDTIVHALHVIAGCALVVTMLVVVADVGLRFLFNYPITGAYDVVGMALLVMTVGGIAPVVANGSEILIDLVDAVAGPRRVRILKLSATVAGAALFLFFGWAMIGPAVDSWSWGERSLELGIPKWPLWAAVFAGLLGILWAYVVRLRASTAGGEDHPSDGGASA